MKYSNLNELINSSLSTRSFFLSLPVETQMRLHEQNEYIHSASELHSRVFSLPKLDKAVFLSQSLDQYFE